MPPTPPSSHGSDSEGSQSPVHAPPGLSRPTSPGSPAPAQPALKASPRGSSSSSLSNSPLLTAAHVRSRTSAQKSTPDRALGLHLATRVCVRMCRNFRARDR